MGFSSSLQGAASSEALLARQDAEIRLLESMRRCLVQRVKAEREYAVALTAFVTQAGGAKVDPALEQTGSTVARAWSSFVEESDKLAKYVKEGADTLAGDALERLQKLHAEKKANRKQYHEESQKISLELTRLQSAVSRAREEYETGLKSSADARQRLVELCDRKGSKAAASRKIDDAKARLRYCHH